MDSERFKALLLPLSDELYRIAYRMLGTREDAQDVVQETFVKLWNHRDKLFAASSPKAFAITTLRNGCIDFLRENRRWERDAAIEREKTDNDDSEMKFRMILSAAEFLPQMQKKVFILRYLKDCKIKEIALLTGLSQTNVRVMLLRARNDIKRRLENNEEI